MIMDNAEYYCKKNQKIKQYNKYYYLKNKDRIEKSNQNIQELKEYYWKMYIGEPKLNDKVDEIVCNLTYTK